MLRIAERGIAQIPRAVSAQKRKVRIGIDAKHAGIGDDALRRPRSLICRDDPTTWLLVKTSPSGEITIPEPRPPRWRAPGVLSLVSTRTTAGPNAFGHADDGIRIGIEQELIAGGRATGRSAAWTQVVRQIFQRILGKIQHG